MSGTTSGQQLQTQASGTVERDQEQLSDAGAADPEHHLTRDDLTDDQKRDILNKVLRSTNSQLFPFIAELEADIIPKDFGLSMRDLEIVLHPDRWTRHGRAQDATTAVQKIKHMIHLGAQRFGTRNGDSALWIYYHKDPGDTNTGDPEPDVPPAPPIRLAYPANQPGNQSGPQQESNPAPVLQTQYSVQNGARGFNPAELARQHAAGSRRVLSFRPRTVQRQVKPGYTASGEEICCIQPLGPSRANFVVRDSDESYRLVDSSTAGGIPTIEAAKAAGKPLTVSDQNTIMFYQQRVRSGGEYGLLFVAPGVWDTEKSRLPLMVVGFYHVSPQTPRVEAAVSRSNLGKILSSRQADHMIVQGMGGDSHWSLRDALAYQLSMEAPLGPTHINFPSQRPMAVLPNQSGPPDWQTPYYGGNWNSQRMPLAWNEQAPMWFQRPQQPSQQFPTQEFQSIPYQQPAAVYPQYTTEPVNRQQASNYMAPAYQQQPPMMPYNPSHMPPQFQASSPQQARPQGPAGIVQPTQQDPNYMAPAYQQQPPMMPHNPLHMVPQSQAPNPQQAISQNSPSIEQQTQQPLQVSVEGQGDSNQQ
ncbi:hypothetical protein CBS147347_5855 [Aspergillus niger]|nr:hypothetical protein CBS147347_5855 [Aspergillus niger]